MSWASLVNKQGANESPEQKQANEQARIQRQAQEKQDREALQLARRVQAVIEARDGGVSAQYGSDEQYEVTGIYTRDVINAAYTIWRNTYTPVQQVALNIHKLGPTRKYTGDRNGACQYNFIRKVMAGGQGRFNVHINVSGNCD